MLRVLILTGALAGLASAELIATFSQGEATDVRVDRRPALQVPQGEPPTPFLSPGKFSVVWKGSLELKQRQRLEFSFGGEGAAKLLVDGKELHSEEGVLGATKSERARLNPGFHDLEVHYQSTDDGSGTFRLYWEEAKLPRQTIPPGAYTAEISTEAKQGELKRLGRLAFTQHHCAKCHTPTEGLGTTPMPETGEIGPILVGIGERVTEDWLQRWIADPKALKPTTHMPQLVDPTTPEGRQKTADLAAYLASVKLGGAPVVAPDASLAKEGGVHFHELGCVACHTPPGSEVSDEGRVPLNNVASKYLPGQLVSYLKKPDAFHPFTDMPDFLMSDKEAASIAAFIREASTGKETKLPYEFPEGDAARGAQIAEELQCGVCHAGSPGAVSNDPTLDDIFKADWATKSCVSEEDPHPGLPNLNLRGDDRAGLIAFLKEGHASLKQDNTAEFAERQLTSKNCTACHTIGEDYADLNTLHVETADLAAHLEHLNERADQSRPHLTYVGEMLYTTYIEAMLKGTVQPRPRPWLGTRMPAFRPHAETFAAGLSRLHGVEPSAPVKIEVDPALAGIGETLVGDTGFGCTTCHGVGEKEATAAFEVSALNFLLAQDRLRPEFYFRWMDHPAAITPGSKMPKYADGNQSQRGDVLEGDARKQYEAILHYLHSLHKE